MYLAIDPGKGRVDSIGAAKFATDGSLLFFGQFTYEDFVPWLEEQTDIEKLFYEEYRIFARAAKKQIGSRVETAECIGVIKSWATRHKVPLVAQRPDILSTAEKMFQVKIPSDHSISHQFSALLHGLYGLHALGLIPTELQRLKKLEREAQANG